VIDGADFEAAFHGALEDVLGWGVELADDDGPRTIEAWDSLAHIAIVQELESRFGVRLPDGALTDEQTVGSLRRLVLDCAEPT
jgi:acyl carrier protein